MILARASVGGEGCKKAPLVRLPFEGETYALRRQWIIWRVLSHDVHHGGELTTVLGRQGIACRELGAFGGHLPENAPLAEPS